MSESAADASAAWDVTATGRRRVLVTGAASGLGSALVRACAAQGDRVLATDRAWPERDGPPAGPASGGGTGPDGVETADGGSAAVARLVLDVTDDADWDAARAWVSRHWGGLDVLVNNAGIAGGGRLDVAPLAEWWPLIEVNLLGVVRGTQAFVPMLKEQRSGHVVNVASLAGLVHPAGMASYNAVKAAVVAFSETAGHELAGHGVRCSAVCPSYFRTNLLDSLHGADEAVGAVVRHLVESSPVTADDIAAEILAGVDAGQDVIVPDDAARAAYRLKVEDRAAYDVLMRDQAAKLDAAAGAER